MSLPTRNAAIVAIVPEDERAAEHELRKIAHAERGRRVELQEGERAMDEVCEDEVSHELREFADAEVDATSCSRSPPTCVAEIGMA